MRNPLFLHFSLTSLQRFGLALAIFVIAFALRYLFLPVSGGYPFVTLYPATIFVMYLCGISTGLSFTVCSALLGYYVFVPPYWGFGFQGNDYVIVVYYLIGSVLAAMVLYPLSRQVEISYRMLEQLKDSESRFRAFMDSSNFIAWMKDEEGRYVFMNKPSEKIFESPPDVWEGRTDFDIFPRDYALYLRELDDKALNADRPLISEDSATTPDGEVIYWFSTRFRYVDSAGKRYTGGIAVDITEHKKAEMQVENLAFYDPLTNLPNRRLLLDRLQHALDNAVRQKHLCALLFIDLDNFKTLNDTYGHNRGDMLLMQVAQRLSQTTRKSDTLARLGGDEFVMLLENLPGDNLEAANEAQSVAEKLLGALGQPYALEDTIHSSTPSIGITLLGMVEEAVDEPLRRADLAMYEAKAAGRNTFRFFDPQLQEEVAKRTFLEADLRAALQDDQFALHYQAQVDGSNAPFCAEALLRWQHPQRGMISPAEFIPVAEDSGLIISIGRWVIETACRQLVQWADQPGFEHLGIAVNVSLRQFYQADFVEQVRDALAKTGANPDNLKLELTESLLAVNVEDVIKKMTALKAQGIGFSLDDFGTGYSSLAYLKRLPLDQLKIDQNFVRDTLTDTNDAAIVKTIIALAASLNLQVIAEGVETDDQRAFLAENGCETYQGYLFSKPLPVEEFEVYVEQASQNVLGAISTSSDTL